MNFITEILFALRDCIIGVWFILAALGLSFIAIHIGDIIADKRERAEAERQKRRERRLRSLQAERELRDIENARAYRLTQSQNDASWAHKFGSTR